MYTTNVVPRNTIAPYWNEIKKWSREDRRNLAELLEESLTEETSGGMAEDFAGQLDDRAMRAAADFAFQESRAGKCVPHSQVLDLVKGELGWKWCMKGSRPRLSQT